MIGDSKERIALFVDGANMYHACKALNLDIDYKRLLSYFSSRGRLIRAQYYTAVHPDQQFNAIRPLLDWLDFNGFNCITKDAKTYTNPDTGVNKVKGNMDIEMCVDMFKLMPYIDHIYLFTGDGDFVPLVKHIQEHGVRVTVVSTFTTRPSMVADNLRRQADAFIDLGDQEIRSRIGKGEHHGQ